MFGDLGEQVEADVTLASGKEEEIVGSGEPQSASLVVRPMLAAGRLVGWLRFVCWGREGEILTVEGKKTIEQQ